MHANKIYQIILVICVIMGLLSSGSGKGMYAAQVTTSKTGTGLSAKSGSPTVPKTTSHGKDNLPTQTKPKIVEKKACDSQCKIDQLTDLGIHPEIASSLVINCKALADNPVHCIKFGATLVANESGGGYKCRKRNQYNCSGMDVWDNYKSYNDGILHWIGKYNKYWYKAKDMNHFYSPAGSLPPTLYCTSEESSKTKVGCPNGLRHSTSFYNKITF